LLALEIELAGESDLPGERTEFFGQVTSMDAGSWVVGGLTFLITPDTEIEDDIVVGDFVKVEAFVAADGTMTAHEIELEDDASGDDDDGDMDDDSDDGEDDEHEDEDDDHDDDDGEHEDDEDDD
jgi:hypothetical protein